MFSEEPNLQAQEAAKHWLRLTSFVWIVLLVFLHNSLSYCLLLVFLPILKLIN